ncbi:MAG: 30S ribosomal protein S3 [Candidatus Harrisonbacteria bacterium]|nr:30S ribosomal protein S3 [Candidatus Harrisonbacteria bacterium]
MAQKIRPDSLRTGITKDWKSRWFARGSYKNRLEEDFLIRQLVEKEIKLAGIVSIEIERDGRQGYRIIIKAAKPGIVIGRGGKGIEELSAKIRSKLESLLRRRGENKPNILLSLNVEELKRNEISAQYVAQQIAWDIEKRFPFRRAMKRAVENAMQNQDVEGVKMTIGGRLNGAEIARSETLSRGKLPLQTLRANIDYAQATAYTTYGTIGIKVWVYKGMVFEKDKEKGKK